MVAKPFSGVLTWNIVSTVGLPSDPVNVMTPVDVVVYEPVQGVYSVVTKPFSGVLTWKTVSIVDLPSDPVVVIISVDVVVYVPVHGV